MSAPLSRRLGLAIAVLAVALAAAAPARAGVLVASAPSCAPESLSKVFLPWADVADYVLAPGGTFEGGADGWSLGGAAVGAGSETYAGHGEGETSSLSLPDPVSATSPSMCVGLDDPTLRFFVRQTAGAALAQLKVEALFEDAGGEAQSLVVGYTGGVP